MRKPLFLAQIQMPGQLLMDLQELRKDLSLHITCKTKKTGLSNPYFICTHFHSYYAKQKHREKWSPRANRLVNFLGTFGSMYNTKMYDTFTNTVCFGYIRVFKHLSGTEYNLAKLDHITGAIKYVEKYLEDRKSQRKFVTTNTARNGNTFSNLQRRRRGNLSRR